MEVAHWLQDHPIVNVVTFLIGLAVIVGLIYCIVKSNKIANIAEKNSKGAIKAQLSGKQLLSGTKLLLSGKWTPEQREFLQSILPADKIMEVLKDQTAVDKYFYDAYTQIKRGSETDVIADKKLLTLFDTRNTVNFYYTPDSHNNMRQYKRAKVEVNASFQEVTLVEQKGTKKKKMELSGAPEHGTVINISGGGCALETDSAMQVGEFLKVELALPNKQGIKAVGKIVNIKTSANKERVVHIHFIRIPSHSKNAINAFVYGYTG
jgi:hypothetical protein